MTTKTLGDIVFEANKDRVFIDESGEYQLSVSTGYALQMITNNVFESLNISKWLPTAFFYNYMKNNMIKKGEEGKVTFTTYIQWFEKYFTKHHGSITSNTDNNETSNNS